MLYYLFTYLDNQFDFPGAGLFGYISFRAGAAFILSLLITTVFGKNLIAYLRRKQVGETIRDLGLEGQMKKQGTPTMGGLIILLGVLLTTILFAKIDNIYIILMLVATVWMGIIGFIDDYIKVFKKDKEGLQGKFKVMAQIGLGLFIGLTMYYHQDIVVREVPAGLSMPERDYATYDASLENNPLHYGVDVKSTKTNVPFIKDNEFDYGSIVAFLGEGSSGLLIPIVFVLAVIIIITAVSNGANITDGIDGLATGSSAIIGGALGLLAYVSGNLVFADYLSIMYIPNSGELMVFMGAFIGSCIGFLWYNAFPAQVFMGDTGSLAIGGIIAAFAILIRKELLIPVLCGIFLIENLSVIMQVSWFKYTRKKYGEGRRIFKMSPLHHHYQMLGYHESKIVTRFWIVGIILAVVTIVTLKIR
ncbi:phospho-N-acetylmuramoyl-pentapeptide-transferase [Anseongella ginsenosidimutans]|uniref:Phospho-N-acetylmuramoyl-pentapeptide-transferase n=1 Tax=Anseongella ginsenosidimutans TaxID=496056 RepID=A0A4R3KXF3_9SPHI|nr:phospho-N-acetylmuramoyl-pentapeptide-transferase [Anseongella ginsenosidimutans]QEC50977.1 phospho-N-acetylmuramoyl-pentapeptide-transferase [Anseongella ginsenosidimutans]TCS90375.1 phospho-N-acetylmuramoyl-pentapeptide-transferase [Anseongella ginsenosidimutans]